MIDLIEKALQLNAQIKIKPLKWNIEMILTT